MEWVIVDLPLFISLLKYCLHTVEELYEPPVVWKKTVACRVK